MPVHCGTMGGGENRASTAQGEQCSASGLGTEVNFRAQYERSPYTGSFQVRPVNRKWRKITVVLVFPSFFLHLLTFGSSQLAFPTLNTGADYQQNINPIHTKTIVSNVLRSHRLPGLLLSEGEYLCPTM